MRRVLLLAPLLTLLLAAPAQAAGIKLRPQGESLLRAVQAVIAELSSPDVPMTLDTSGGPTLTLGGVGVTSAPFNPDESGRIVVVGGERRLELNPRGPVPLAQALRDLLRDELKLRDWTPVAAQLRFGGADLNGDGQTDLSDLALLMESYGKPGAYVGDLNQDRKVNDADVQLFMAQYRAAFAYQDPLGQPVPAVDTPAKAPETLPVSTGGSSPVVPPSSTTPSTSPVTPIVVPPAVVPAPPVTPKP